MAKEERLIVAVLKGGRDITIKCTEFSANELGAACYIKGPTKDTTRLVAFFPIGDLAAIYDNTAGEKSAPQVESPSTS